jgi:hypothetical protein
MKLVVALDFGAERKDIGPVTVRSHLHKRNSVLTSLASGNHELRILG